MSVTPRKNNRHGIRHADKLSKEQYVEKVLETFEFEGNTLFQRCSAEEVKQQLLKEDFNDFGMLEILTGLQASLQIVLEYIVLIDKVCTYSDTGIYITERFHFEIAG